MPADQMCGAVADPNSPGYVICEAGGYCEQVKGHDGGHAARPSVCTRPRGHTEAHIYATQMNPRLYQWGYALHAVEPDR